MGVFFNFFGKTIAFFLAITVFIIILVFLLNFLLKNNEITTNNKFLFKEGNINSDNKIFLIKLNGPILNEPTDILEFSLARSIEIIYVSEFIKSLKELEKENIKGLVISINSPGGSVSATYNLYNALNKFKKENDVKIFFHTNELLASGGYWFALASDKIIASYGSIIGSIGVQGPDWIHYNNPITISTGILGQTVETKDGIKNYNTIAGKSKDLFNPFRMPTKMEKKSLEEMVNVIYSDFVNVVSKNRSIENDFILNELGALVFEARKAKENFLIDDIDDLTSTIKHIVQELKLSDYKVLEQKKEKGIIKEFVNLLLVNQNNLNDIRNNRVCKLISDQINVIIKTKSLMNNC